MSSPLGDLESLTGLKREELLPLLNSCLGRTYGWEGKELLAAGVDVTRQTASFLLADGEGFISVGPISFEFLCWASASTKKEKSDGADR